MPALYIILAILALITLPLLLPLRIYLHYAPESGFCYRVKYLFLTLVDSTKEPKPKQPKKPAKKKPSAGKKKESDGKAVEKLLDLLGLQDVSSKLNFRRAVDSKGLIEAFRGVAAAVGALFSRIGRLVRRSVFKRFDLKITVGDADAADAAFRYGEVCAAVYPLLTLLDRTMKFKKRSVDIGCDFEREDIAAVFDGQLNYRPVHIVSFLFWLIGRYIRQSAKK
ncbi:MAG: hypothetical protein IJG45_03930 [Oscillospiraceae bacterium]|nr:hypothetical protein [Oscillospiraceae bacterium]